MAANLLWAHLLRRDATTTDTPSQIPPIAPQDRTGTSMRMLIHDTQANLEKFSTRLDGLLHRVEDCRAQVVNTNKLLDVERDKVLTEILEIAKRCQSEMKVHVGMPAQATALDLVHVSQVSTEKSVQALEKRIDALQALLQTHVHVMQSIQDQQNTLIGAILPLVPILHGVPPQMDQIKVALSDVVANAVSTMTSNVESVRSTLVAEYAHGHARCSTRVGSSHKSMSSLQRKRSNPVLGPQEIVVPPSSPLDSRSHGGPYLSPKRARIEGTMHHTGNAPLPRKFSRPAVPLPDSSDPPPLRTPQTPRQPLADLPLPPGSNTSRIQHCTQHSTSRDYMRPLDILPATGGRFTISRSPSQPLEDARPGRSHRDKLAMAAEPLDQDVLSKAVKIEDILVPNLTGFFSIHSSPLSSPLQCEPSRTVMQQQETMTDAPQVQVTPPLSDPNPSNPETSPPKSMSLRDRRAQISRVGRTETRRFIPLVPWSDEEE